MNRFKKESYVKQRQSKSTGLWTFQVRVGDNVKSFCEKDYGDARSAYDNAVHYRNKCLSNIHEGAFAYTNNVCLKDVFEDTFEYLPVRVETKRKHIMLFNKYFPIERAITSITRSDIIRSLNSMISDNSDDNINRVLSIWRRLFKTAILEGFWLAI